MKKGYWIVAYHSVSDEAALLDTPARGCRRRSRRRQNLVRTSDVRAFESGLRQRTTVVEFESLDKALATHNSDAYQHALKALGSAVD